MTYPLPVTLPAWSLTAVSYASPDASRLTQALYREQLATYGFADDPADTPPGEFDPPHGRFFVASAAGGPAIACCRMAHRCRAWHRRVQAPLRRPGRPRAGPGPPPLEQDALRHGKTRAILETGARSHAALALCISCGFTFTEPYVKGRNPDINRAMQKTLRPTAEEQVARVP
jgi:hypothetical protein